MLDHPADGGLIEEVRAVSQRAMQLLTSDSVRSNFAPGMRRQKGLQAQGHVPARCSRDLMLVIGAFWGRA